MNFNFRGQKGQRSLYAGDSRYESDENRLQGDEVE